MIKNINVYWQIPIYSSHLKKLFQDDVRFLKYETFVTISSKFNYLNSKTFKELIFSKKGMLFRVAYRILNNHMDAEDAVSNVLFKCWEKRSRFKELENLDKILFTAIRNECIDLLRKKKHEILIKKELKNESINFDNAHLIKSKTDHINEIIFQLPETQKLILHLRMIEGYKISQIAELVNMKVNTVEVSLSRARKKIRAEYEKRISNH